MTMQAFGVGIEKVGDHLQFSIGIPLQQIVEGRRRRVCRPARGGQGVFPIEPSQLVEQLQA